MSNYKIDTEELVNAYSKLQDVLTNLQSASSQVNSAYNKMNHLSGGTVDALRYEIVMQGNVFDAQWHNVKILADYLQTICLESEKAENDAKRLLNQNYKLAENMTVDSTWVPRERELELFTVDNGFKALQNLVGKAGVQGKIIKSVWKATDADNGLEVLKQGVSIVGTAAKEILMEKEAKESLTFWKRLGKRIKNEASEFGKQAYEGTAKKVTEDVRCGTKWAGLAIDGVFNLANNISEFGGDMSNSRLYEETVIETALSVGKDILVNSVIGAATVGLGPVGFCIAAVAPILTDHILDKASEMITGNDNGWLENTSDAIINGAHWWAEKKAEFGGAVTNLIGKGISVIGKSVMTVWA